MATLIIGLVALAIIVVSGIIGTIKEDTNSNISIISSCIMGFGAGVFITCCIIDMLL